MPGSRTVRLSTSILLFLVALAIGLVSRIPIGRYLFPAIPPHIATLIEQLPDNPEIFTVRRDGWEEIATDRDSRAKADGKGLDEKQERSR